MTYDLIADGETVNLGDRKYLLSPQDLAGLELIPELIQTGVTSLKIEGRLKTPEYVANVTHVYRQAIDQAMIQKIQPDSLPVFDPRDRYNLEMAFSRGLSTGWFRGINNQTLVHARFGKKRGVYLGEVSQIRGDQIVLRSSAPIKPGDGVVFDSSNPATTEQGGRVYAVESHGTETRLSFGRRDLNLKQIHIGDRVWKTSDPDLDRQLRQTFTSDQPQFQRPIALEIYGEIGQPMTAIVRDELGHIVQVESTLPLVAAHTQPLTRDRLAAQLGRLGNTPFRLATLTNHLIGDGLLPVSELNRLRREFVTQLEAARSQPQRWQLNPTATVADLLPSYGHNPAIVPQLIVLVRNLAQLQAAIDTGIETLYCEFEDPRAYRAAVELKTNLAPDASLFVAPPRITKPGENWILQQVRSAGADGYLVRNYDQLQAFAGERCVGDFSLNVANPLTADYLQHLGLARLTASYDLNLSQLEALLTTCPPAWFEVTIHQHMPMFHMEHCVFCAFLSDGTDHTNCDRPCEKHTVKLRDRVGTEHILLADAGCRNTVFNGTAQTGAEAVQRLLKLGLRNFRIEMVNETPPQVKQLIDRYDRLLRGKITGTQLWRELKLHNQLGVTRGALEKN
jgi:putative protease